MKNADIKHIQTAGKYAKALFQQALGADIQDRVYDDIVFISETINSNADLKNVLKNPAVMLSDKKEIIKKLFSLHVNKLSLDFILLLVDAYRLDCLNETVNCYQRENNKKNNILTPVIISAVSLENEEKERIITRLESKTNKAILPEYSVDRDIIGGLIIEIGDKTIDCSLQTKFENMKKHLTKGNGYGKN